MAHTIMFDTLAFAKELENAGVPTVQAEAHAKVMVTTLQRVEESRLEELASKRDVELVKAELKKDIELAKAELRKDIESSRVEVIKWVVATGMVILGGVTAANRLLPPNPIYVQMPTSQEMRSSPMTMPAPPNQGK